MVFSIKYVIFSLRGNKINRARRRRLCIFTGEISGGKREPPEGEVWEGESPVSPLSHWGLGKSRPDSWVCKCLLV